MATKKETKAPAAKKDEPKGKPTPKKEEVKGKAEAKADKKAEPKKSAEVSAKSEEPKAVTKFEPMKSDDFCKEVDEAFSKGIYGLYDPNNKTCQDCSKDKTFKAAFEACKYNTEEQAKEKEALRAAKAAPKAKKEKDPNAPKKERVSNGEKSLLGHIRTSCDLDKILFRPEGASVEEIQAIRPSFQSHLYHIKKEHNANVVKKDGRYYATI